MSQFPKYNGWTNYPTWDVFTAISSYEGPYQDAVQVCTNGTAQEAGMRLKSWVEQRLNFYTRGMLKGETKDAFYCLYTDLSGYASLPESLAAINWTEAAKAFKGE